MLKLACRLVILCLLAALVAQPAAVVTGAAGMPPGPGQPHSGMQSPQAPSSASWYDGLIQYSTITNCASIIFGDPYQEEGAGTYVGFYADPNNSLPAPGVTYYVHVLIYGLGNSCSGMRAYIDLALPASTSLAITGTNKVLCYYDGTLLQPSDCPQVLPASSYNPGAFQIPSTDSAHADTWPIPQGHNLEIQIPVVSSAALSNSPLQANVWMLDGNSSPWLRPTEGVYVFNSGASTPTIVYPSPSTLTVTTTTAHSQAYLYTHNLTGTGFFDLGTDTSYSFIHDPLTITAPSTAWLVYDDWGPPALLPDTLYHWRFEFHDSGGHDIFGADQTFRTLSDGQVTLGDGTPTNCTAPNFEGALPTARLIEFNCGALPITITLSSNSRPITTNVTIDGGNKVTLDAGNTNQHFDVQSGGALTLTAITLQNGSASCGGAILVDANARLTLNQARLLNNQSGNQGGAVCIQPNGTASITGSLFRDNRAGNFGGAIGNYGTADISDSKFISNTAPINGGGIDATGLTTVTASTFVSNAVGFRGGGIYNFLGQLTVSSSSLISNTAGAYGGGLGNDSSGTWVTGTTLSDNYSGSDGGGIESAGTLTLTNSTVSGNHAHLTGGGLEWTPGAGLMLLNDTLVSNTAGTQGGNITVGGTLTASVTLKNTLVAFGSPNNCDGPVVTQGHNLENTNVCGFTAGGDVRNANPKIGPLSNNGGLTLTHALKPGSPAIDAGTNSGCPATDQRGVARPKDGNGNGVKVCDIGAYEAPTKPILLFLPLLRR